MKNTASYTIKELIIEITQRSSLNKCLYIKKKHLHKIKVRIRVLSIDRFLQKVGTPEIYDTPVFRYGKRATKTCFAALLQN